MTGTSITITDQDVNDMLARLYAAGGDVTPALKNIGEFEAKVTRGRFVTETDPEGKAWKELNSLYARTKKGPGILRGATRSLSQIVWQLADDSVEIGSNVVYARVHNEGATIVPKNAAALIFSMGGQTFQRKSVEIPQRQFLGWSDTSSQQALLIVQDHFVDAAEGK